jgi:hypothetical protein
VKYILRLPSLRISSVAFGVLACVAGINFIACSPAADDASTTGGAAAGGAGAVGGTPSIGGGTPSVGGGAPAGGAGAGGAAAGGAAACDIDFVLNRNCSAVSCHGTPAATTPVEKPAMPPNELGSGLDLFSPGVEARVYNKPGSYTNVADPTTCPTATPELLIDPAGLDTSLMWKKIQGTQACGEQMPNGGITFDDTETACFKAWLESILAAPPL